MAGIEGQQRQAQYLFQLYTMQRVRTKATSTIQRVGTKIHAQDSVRVQKMHYFCTYTPIVYTFSTISYIRRIRACTIDVCRIEEDAGRT